MSQVEEYNSCINCGEELQEFDTDKCWCCRQEEEVCGENGYRCEECTVCARTKPCECGCGLLGGSCENCDEEVVYDFYICNKCCASNDDGGVDCWQCNGKRCVYLYQEETEEDAIEEMQRRNRMKAVKEKQSKKLA